MRAQIGGVGGRFRAFSTKSCTTKRPWTASPSRTRSPTRALAALLAVEEEPRARQRLAALIQRHGRVEQTAFLAGTRVNGEARLLQSLPSLDPESLRVTWKGSKIEAIEIESPYGPTMEATAPAVSVSVAVETLTPLLWQHIRAGGRLPEGVERFAGFFSGPSSP